MMKNCEFYGLFDYTSGDGDTYEYTSAEWSHYLKGITGNGISKNTLNEFAPSANGLAITIASGEAYIEGRYAYNTTATQFNLSPTSSGQKRYDRIVVELDEASRVIGLDVVAGTATSSTPAKPVLTSKQLPICSILVENGSTTTLTDERTFTYSATAVQENFLPITGGTLNGYLNTTQGATFNGEVSAYGDVFVLRDAYPGFCLRNRDEKNLSLWLHTVSDGSFSDAHLWVYKDENNYSNFTFGKDGSLVANSYYGNLYSINKLKSAEGFFYIGNTDDRTNIYMELSPFQRGIYSRNSDGTQEDWVFYSPNTTTDWIFNGKATSLTDTLPISLGGTGATTASGALSNLGIIYSATEPTAGNGSIWLKPVS